MPRILRIINRFNLGGPTYNAAYLSKYMPSQYETMLIGGEKEDHEESSMHILNDLGLNPVIIPEMKRSINPMNDYNTYKKIKAIIKDFKPDIVHTHAAKAGTIGRLAAYNSKVPIIVHTFHGHVFHSYFNKAKTSLFKNIERNLASKSTRIIAISEKQKYELGTIHRICRPEKLEVIPLGFDLSRFQENIEEKRLAFRKQYNIADDEIAIGIVGRIVPVKNHELFVRAWKEVSEKTTKKIRAFIVGDGEDRAKTEALAKELGLSICTENFENSKCSLTFTSWIKDVDVVNAGVDIIALSSLNEGTPVSLIEAQAGNNPVVSTKVGGIENVVIHNKTGLLSEVGDTAGYAANLLKLIEDDDLRSKMQKEGWESVREKFHYTRLIKDMDKLYSTLLKSK
ncbi:MAG: glycosyltransferase [Bacteroidetes bacterium]|nr:glycosyltransferase [Bacteroidota bacterium]